VHKEGGLGTMEAILLDILFFFLEQAGELRIFILREKKRSNYKKTIHHLGP
jgi:hypothetical protein